MVLFKKQFFGLTIHKQVQIGVASVSLCVCFLSMVLVTLSSYVILNLSYQDVISVIETKENESIEEIGAYVDTAILNMVEMKKYSIQFMKNFIKNNKQNRDFINNIVYKGNDTKLINVDSAFYNKLGNLTDSERMEKIVYKVMQPPENPEIEEELNFSIRILNTAIPLFKKILDFRFIHSTNFQIFDHIEIISNEYSVIFYYPATSFIDSSNKFSYENFQETIEDITNWCAYDFKSYIDQYTSNQKFSNYYKNAIVQNPFMTFTIDMDNTTIPFLYNFNESPMLISTRGITYKDLPSSYYNNKLPLFLGNSSNILEIISGDSISSDFESYVLSLINNFDDINILISIRDTPEYLVTTTSCLYLIDLYQKYSKVQSNSNNILIDEKYFQNFSNSIQTVDVCFKDPIAKEKFLYYFNNGEGDYYPFIRKAKFSIFNTNSTLPLKKMKIFKFQLPDTKTIINTRSKFMKNYALNLYVLKNPSYLQNKINQVTSVFTHFIFNILWVNAVFWCLCIIIILCLLSDIAEKISKPIKKIIDLVKSIQLNDKKAMKLDRIRFPDDKDIDDFFNVCTNLIRGGFSDLTDDKLKYSRKDFDKYTSQDNVTVVKSNNYIIQDDLIDNNSEMASIFDKQRKEVDVNDSKIDGVNLFVRQESKATDSDFLLNNSYNKSCDSISVASSFWRYKKTNTNLDSINLDKGWDSILFDDIFKIVENQDRLITGKSYLYDLFLVKTNNGDDLKLNR